MTPNALPMLAMPVGSHGSQIPSTPFLIVRPKQYTFSVFAFFARVLAEVDSWDAVTGSCPRGQRPGFDAQPTARSEGSCEAWGGGCSLGAKVENVK